MTKTRLLLLLFVISISASAQSKPDDDKGPDLSGSWPTTYTLEVLKDAGLVKPEQVDATKTHTLRLASEKVGNDLWNQMYLVTFTLRNGSTIKAIAHVNASSDPDMRNGPAVYVVSKVLNPEGRPAPAKRVSRP